MIRVVDATPEIAIKLAACMREADAEEVVALGMTPLQALEDGMRVSFLSHAAIDDDGMPIAMWGTCGLCLLGERAQLWFLSGTGLPKHKRHLLHWSRLFVAEMQAQYELLECVVDLRYDAAVRWVKWLGFVPKAQFVSGGTLFHLMARRRV